jgi:hypothetical protein
MTDRMERYATLAIRVGTTPVVITRPGVSIVWPTPEQMAATAQAHADHVAAMRARREAREKLRAAMERAEMIVETFDYNGVHVETRNVRSDPDLSGALSDLP